MRQQKDREREFKMWDAIQVGTSYCMVYPQLKALYGHNPKVMKVLDTMRKDFEQSLDMSARMKLIFDRMSGIALSRQIHGDHHVTSEGDELLTDAHAELGRVLEIE